MTKFDELKQRYNLHSTYTKLTKAQEHALIKELRNDNTEEWRKNEIKDIFFNNHINMVFKAVWLFENQRRQNVTNTVVIDIEDLVSWGAIGLYDALDKIDLKRDVRFSTVAFWWIKQRIKYNYEKNNLMVRTPQAKHQEENFKKMGANRGLLEQWIPFTTEVEKICDSGEDERGTNIETEIKNTELWDTIQKNVSKLEYQIITDMWKNSEKISKREIAEKYGLKMNELFLIIKKIKNNLRVLLADWF